MEDELSFWGFVFIHVNDEGKPAPVLVIRDEKGKFIAPIAISDFEKQYKTLGKSKISIVKVVLKDGTTPITLKEAFSVPEFENVFFSIKDIASSGIVTTNKKGVTKQHRITTVLRNDPNGFIDWVGQMIDDCIYKETRIVKKQNKKQKHEIYLN